MPLTREEHGEARSGRISSSVASLLISGTKAGWERLAGILDDPPPFYAATCGPMADGVRNEPKVVATFFERHPELVVVENPGVVYHHNTEHRYRKLLIASPDRIVDGRPLEVKWATTKERFDHLTRPMPGGYVPSEHRDQVEWQMWIMGVNEAWFAVGGKRRFKDVFYQKDDLSHIDRMLEIFMDQYSRYSIRGIKG